MHFHTERLVRNLAQCISIWGTAPEGGAPVPTCGLPGTHPCRMQMRCPGQMPEDGPHLRQLPLSLWLATFWHLAWPPPPQKKKKSPPVPRSATSQCTANCTCRSETRQNHPRSTSHQMLSACRLSCVWHHARPGSPTQVVQVLPEAGGRSGLCRWCWALAHTEKG